jgi:histidine triad (HIT) family protein
MTTNCVFCDIVQGKAPATIVCEWEDALALVPLGPVTTGHVIVIPKVHVPDALADPQVSAIVMARASELAVGPCNLIVNVGREATQSVFHLHLHIVPRAKDDGLALPWYSGKGNFRGK